MKEFLSKLKSKQNLSFEESKAAFEVLMNGEASEVEIFDFLTLLSAKDKFCLLLSFDKNSFIFNYNL
jgi:anthranilate phosphoribosyltransferase